MKYDGISADTLFLAAQNRFENNKTFYEEHKEELKKGFTVPMRQIASIVTDELAGLDDKMETNPVKMVSRFYRDTRFSKNKNLYRDNLWVMFMRNKNSWPMYPFMWFEVTQEHWDYGIGMFWCDARYLEIYRKMLIEKESEFLKAVRCAEKTGALFSADYYKKDKPGEPSNKIYPYYNLKSFSFSAHRTDFETLSDERLIPELVEIYRNFAPMYTFLKRVADKRYSE